jgi:hypothetical protein
MPPVQSRVYRKALKGQSRKNVANVLQFMQKEADEHIFVAPVNKEQEHVAFASGLSKFL